MEGSSINIWITQCLSLHACVSFNLIFSPLPNAQSSQTPNFQIPAVWAENNANDSNEVLNLTSTCLLCAFPYRGTEQMECVLAQKVCDHSPSLRSICLNDLYCHQNLWELTVEGDIHGAVSPVANESLGCLMSGQRSEEREESPCCRLCQGKWWQI